MLEVADRVKNINEYYFSIKLRLIKEMENRGEEVINMGIGNPNIPPPKEIIKGLVDSSQRMDIHGYQGYKGIEELREAFSKFYKIYYGLDICSSDEVLPLIGSKEGITHISLALLNPGDKVLVPNPGYPTYTSVTKLIGCKPIYYDLKEKNNWEPKVEDLEKLDLKGVRLMWLNNPHMPTGKSMDNNILKEIVDFCIEKNIYLVNDNPYSLILNDTPQSIFNIENSKLNCLELNSLSKCFNIAGWRIGSLVARKEIIDCILKVKSNIDSGMYYGLQKAVSDFISKPSNWIENLNKTYAQRRKMVWEIGDKIGGKYNKNSSGMFVWIKLPNDQDDIEYVDHLLEDKKIFFAPGSIFGSNGKGYIRISLCVEENKIKEVIQSIGE